MPTHTYTLICYRPNGADYCRGCLMETSDSDFEMLTTRAEDEVVKLWGRKLYADATRTQHSAVCEWQVTLVIDGHHRDESWDDLDAVQEDAYRDLISSVKEKASNFCNVLLERDKVEVARQQQLAAEAAERAAEQAAAAQEEVDRLTYQRLKEKYEPARCS